MAPLRPLSSTLSSAQHWDAQQLSIGSPRETEKGRERNSVIAGHRQRKQAETEEDSNATDVDLKVYVLYSVGPRRVDGYVKAGILSLITFKH